MHLFAKYMCQITSHTYKTITIQCLKLLDDLLLAELMNCVSKATGLTLIDAPCWWDSIVALY